MKLSYEWLCDFIDLSDLDPQEVADLITMGAFEVEEVERVGPSLTGPVIVGEILEIHPHPDADKIRLTKVRLKDGDEPVEIVCGASNIEVGHRIPVALPGAIVVNRKTGEPLEIKESSIRGVKSNGMLCSASELGITGGDEDGILILSNKNEGDSSSNGSAPYVLGEDVIGLLSLKQDWIMHVEPRSNRGDALSVSGLAREVAALVKRPGKSRASVDLEERTGTVTDAASGSELSTSIESTDDCPYFSARIVRGIKVGPSPSWLVRRLESVGMRTVNNIVDITNYVMLEYGQPLHAYDLRHLEGNALHVRRARTGEKLELIDGKEREMSDEVLVIADEKRVVGVAGIMGGKESEISDDTVDIALEAASFNSARVRRGSRLLGVSSESSVRFERGVDPASVRRASDRATELIEKYCLNKQSGSVGKLYQSGCDKVECPRLSLRTSQVKRVLDVDLSVEQIADFLGSLDFEVVEKTADRVDVLVPSFRKADVVREIDLVEEVCRLYGYDNLPVSMPRASASPVPMDDLLPSVRSILAGQGLSEAWISSLRPDNEMGQDPDSVVRVLNPLTADHRVLRRELVPGLLEAAKLNQDHGRPDAWLFEIGRRYERSNDSDADDKTGVLERTMVAGIISGSRLVSLSWTAKKGDKVKTTQSMQERVDFYRLKGVVEDLLEGVGIPIDRVRFFQTNETPPVFHPYRWCRVAVAPDPSVYKGKGSKGKEEKLETIGWLGEVHPGETARRDIRQSVFAFEIDLDSVRRELQSPTFLPIPATPAVTRDLTADITNDIDQASVSSCIRASAGERLINLELVSVFEDDSLENVRSLSYRLTFQDPEKTLTGEELDKQMHRVRNTLIHRLNANFRA